MNKQSPPLPQYPSPTDKSSVAAQFGLTNTNTHGHSGAGMDGGPIDYNNLLNKPAPNPTSTYGGAVLSGGTGTLPTGWSSSADATPVYTIVHNLGTTNYALVTTTDVGLAYHQVVIVKNANDFTVEFLAAGGGSAIGANFDFILTKII